MSLSLCKCHTQGASNWPDIYFLDSATSDSYDLTGRYKFFPKIYLGYYTSRDCAAIVDCNNPSASNITFDGSHYYYPNPGKDMWHEGMYVATTGVIYYKSNDSTISDFANDSYVEYRQFYGYLQSWDKKSYSLVFNNITHEVKYSRTCFARTGGNVAVTSGNYGYNNGRYYILSGSSLAFKATPSNSKYAFAYWEFGGQKAESNQYFEIENDTITFNDYYEMDVDVFAVFAEAFTIAFNANNGTGTIASQSFASGVSKTLTKNNNQITRANYKFTGWNTAADGSGTTYFDGADGSGILTAVGGAAGDTVTLYAQWEFVAFSITATKVNSDASGADVSSIGTLTLFDVTSQDVVAVEHGGSLYYVGETGRQYRLYIDLADTKPDALWRPTGVLVDGAYASEYLFYPSVGQEIKKDFLLTKRVLCTFSAVISPDGVGGSAAVVSPDEPDEDGKYAQGRKITVSVALPDGYENDVVRTASGYEYAVKDGKFTIENLVSDDVATVYIKKSVFRTSVAKDAASEAALSSVSVDGGAFKDAEYGDSVTLAAVVAEGYEFAGWYDGSELLSSDATYSLAVTGAKSIVAKAKVSVKMGVHYTDAGDYLQSCAIQVNGAAYEQGTAIPVTLGESVSYALVLGSLESGGTELWKFNAWFDAPFTERVNPLALGSSGTLTPTAAMNIVAEVTPQVITNVITVVMKEDENAADISQDGAISVYPAADEGGWDAESRCYKLTFHGTKEATLNAADSVTVGSDTLAFSKFEDGTTIREVVSYILQTNGSRTVTAWYGKTGTRTVDIGYAIDGTGRGDRTKGSIAIVSSSDPEAVIDDENNTAVVNRGYTVTIRASAMNGFRFVGWFKTETVGGTPYSEESELTFVVGTNLTLYAWFQKDTNAVFVWEGSDVNKSMEWKSKVYAASRPFNPSALRVDTNGYPVIEIDVDMYSSPDASPTARAIITNLASQQARRLPKRRPERYLQVCVKNDNEVDALFVGTSMGGLAV